MQQFVIIGVALFFQLVFLIPLQTMKMKGMEKWETMAMDFLCKILFVKPGLDAFRVVIQKGRMAGQLFDFDFDTVQKMGRNTEIYCEAIPGVIVQTVALLTTHHAGV